MPCGGVAIASVQGQLLHRLYDGDHRLLDRELRKARRDAPRKVEARDIKRYGKLTRHPVGTVAVLHMNQLDETLQTALSSTPTP
ncbi:macro domain-containing protein [Streptomyces sp. NPDC055025]